MREGARRMPRREGDQFTDEKLLHENYYVRHVHPSYIFATCCNSQEPRPLPAGSSITHLFEYENWKTLEKYIETDVANYLQKLFGMLAELRAERLSQVGKIESRYVVSRCWCMAYVLFMYH